MDNMKSIFGLFVVFWFAFAFFELSFDREIFVSYTASEVADYDPDAGQPRLLPRAVTEYRVQQDSVVSRTGEYVSKYNDCTVFDSDNWTCTYSDESGTFGARRGEFFSRTNLEKFPHLKYLDEEETLSRFRYIMLQCRWDATGGIDAILCLFRPFMT
ncbi:hypothetical protein [uncultured Tateyamaria sp.]|uniref:hypothetical protein n=1 Tax=uncultured Tateyamaria sp. TaxID=455651 RepID=UPI00262DE4A1|nr:hypothetical protein [uncultured Tateyamaria sp.]